MGTCLYPGNTIIQDDEGTVKNENENENEIFNVFSKKIARDLTIKRIVARHNLGGCLRGVCVCVCVCGGGGGRGGEAGFILTLFGLANHSTS